SAVLQKLGKADETKDEQFEQVVVNFRRQESEGSRLQREMKAYMSAIKGMQQASINLSQSLHEVYEPDWHGKDDVLTIGKDCDALWEDFHNKLVDSTLLNLDAYLQQFPDLKTRVAKRSRKLIDYDSARHHVETLQASGMKNDRKMMKAEDELKKAQKVFDELNVAACCVFWQLKKGPPVPPPPKVTPTKEVAEEQIIDLFGGEFLPAPSPSQPNERPGESLLDLDFDAFQPDESVSPIPQVFFSYSPEHQAADSGFVADWAADFGSMSANGDAASGVEPPAAPAAPAAPAEEMQGGAQSWHQAEGWQPGGETTTPIQDNEATATEDEVSSPDSQTNPNLHPYGADEDETGQADSGGHFVGHEDRRKSTPGLLFTNEFGEEIEDSTEVTGDKWCRSPEGSVSEYETENMPIPSVVIEPASSNEGDDDRDADIISPTTISDNGMATETQAMKHMSPSGGVVFFVLQVETMHDFEAANSDELELKRGDVVLVVPTASVEDQDAGWLTGIKESDWLTLGVGAQKGLFPDNFTQRLE
uniref:Amphiphysin n=1 Tax=Stegastes partitus TaxID=144197 RepID=A0A3B5B221_9TELE